MNRLARDIMTREVVCVSTDTDLRDVFKLFVEKGISGAPVIDDNGDVIGVISQSDLVAYNLTRDDELVFDSLFYQSARIEGQHIPRGFQLEDCNTGYVADVMNPIVYSVSERLNAEKVARKMIRHHVHRVIVCRGRKPIGIISATDVLKALADAVSQSDHKH
ncbi:MAG: CBS domain-containing protein [Gammaproteobacteria bacterium]|nr:CBS domain-containing protein [Gammaproteobacteria bacterium]